MKLHGVMIKNTTVFNIFFMPFQPNLVLCKNCQAVNSAETDLQPQDKHEVLKDQILCIVVQFKHM
jgi:hypothetical protein